MVRAAVIIGVCCLPLGAQAETPLQARLKESPSSEAAFQAAGLVSDNSSAYAEGQKKCGTYRPCIDRHVEGFVKLSGAYPDAGPEQRTRMMRILREHTKDGVTDWYWASADYFAPFDIERSKPRITTIQTDCRGVVSKDGTEIVTTCVTQ